MWKREGAPIEYLLERFNIINEYELDDVSFEAEISIYKNKLLNDIQRLNDIYGREVIKIEEDFLLFNTNDLGLIFCIKTAYEGASPKADFTADDIGKMFEYLVLESLPKWKSMYGYKRHEKFHRDLPVICQELDIPNGYHKDIAELTVEDCGVDIIGFCKTRKHLRTGHIYLIQCASGKNFLNKSRDISPDPWMSVFPIGYSKMLAITHYKYENLSSFSKGSIREAGEIFDRSNIQIDNDVFYSKYHEFRNKKRSFE